MLSRIMDRLMNPALVQGLSITRFVLFFLIVACAIVMTVCTLMQSNDNDGTLDVVTGAQESYYSKNKGSSRDGKLKIITIVMAAIIFVCVVACLVIGLFVDANGNA